MITIFQIGVAALFGMRIFITANSWNIRRDLRYLTCLNADFSSVSIWDCIDSIVSHSAVGGHSYDAFIIEILNNAEAEAIATFNTTHFIELKHDLPIIDPAKLIYDSAVK